MILLANQPTWKAALIEIKTGSNTKVDEEGKEYCQGHHSFLWKKKIQFGQVDVKYSPITMSFDPNEDFAL